MCGIVGMFPGNQDLAAKALAAISHRGKDWSAIKPVEGGFFGHTLHSVVGDVPQPIFVNDSALIFNGEIYNWKELAKEEGISVENDAELLAHLLDTLGWDETLPRIDGVFAFAFLKDDVVTLARDLLGVKPLWYSTQNGLYFASEAKALGAINVDAKELHPRTTLRYSLSENSSEATVRPLAFPEVIDQEEALRSAVKKRIPESNKVAVLFSGGVDSSTLAFLCRKYGAEVSLYVAASSEDSPDVKTARESAKRLEMPLTEVVLDDDDVEKLLPELCNVIESSDVVHTGAAIPLWIALERAAADGHRVAFSGHGIEEIFGGYDRDKRALSLRKEAIRKLRLQFERGLGRDDAVSMRHTIELRLPYLDPQFIGATLDLLDKEIAKRKHVFRELVQDMGLRSSLVDVPSKAIQYGSGFDAAIGRLAGRKNKSDYLREFYPRNVKLCALVSSGKDSIYALHVMQKMNYEIACLATVVSENPDSYMFHTPLVDFVTLQSSALEIPLIVEQTPGLKEEELSALIAVLKRAKEDYDVAGVVSGALFSDYQRSRIEQVCEELGLRMYAPLWHLDQEQEVREILDAGFTFIMSKVAADGLDESWVGRPIRHRDIDQLTQMMGLNVAGEGGEFETLVLDGPGFTRKIELSNAQVKCESDGIACWLEATGSLADKES